MNPHEMDDAALSAAVAEQVMGLNVLDAPAHVTAPEGDPIVFPARDIRGNDDPYLCRVYARRDCNCAAGPPGRYAFDGTETPEQRINRRRKAEYDADMARWGHSWHCLTAVPSYATDIAAAWQVVEKMRGDGYTFGLWGGADDDPWEADFSDRPIDWTQARTAPRAICEAALAAIGRDT